jgi:hypothetical protein
LNPTHSEGKHKARVLAAMLGYTTSDAEKLREIILAAVSHHEAVEGARDEHGARYSVDFETQGKQDVVLIRTAWIIDTGETIPRLVSCYVKRN